MRLLIVGGTGTSGRVLTQRAAAAGHDVRILTRRVHRPGPDSHRYRHVTGNVITGAGLDEAVAGVDAVVDLSNMTNGRYVTASEFFTTGTEHLFAAEGRAGVAHHLTVSIVGVDRFPSGYYRAKVDQEATVAAASVRTGVGHTVARVTQFHDFVTTVLKQFRAGPLVLAPTLHIRPVHLHDVADHVLSLLETGPVGRAPDLVGPEREEVPDMVRRYVRAVGLRLLVVPLPLVGPARRANEAGVLLPPTGVRAGLGFEQWLEEVSAWSQQPSHG